MGKIAIMFSGQGAQYQGMGRDLYEHSPAAREVFDKAERIRPGTISQCFSGSSDELARTENTQPCLYCVDLAAAAAIKEAGIAADMLAGFSLGELAALAFSGALTYEDGLRLVCKRAELMQEASEKADTGMVAAMKLSDSLILEICAEYEDIYPVNFNYEGQVVVAGEKDELKRFSSRIKEKGGAAIPLKVSGGFHSPFMDSAAAGFARVLDEFIIERPHIPIFSNVTAEQYSGNVRKLLAKQIRSPVMWSAMVGNMILAGADTFIEAGPGKTLCGITSRISDKIRVFNWEDCTCLVAKPR